MLLHADLEWPEIYRALTGERTRYFSLPWCRPDQSLGCLNNPVAPNLLDRDDPAHSFDVHSWHHLSLTIRAIKDGKAWESLAQGVSGCFGHHIGFHGVIAS